MIVMVNGTLKIWPKVGLTVITFSSKMIFPLELHRFGLKPCICIKFMSQKAFFKKNPQQITVAISSGENSIVVIPGANLKLTPADLEENLSLFKNAKIVICQNEISHESTKKANKYFIYFIILQRSFFPKCSSRLEFQLVIYIGSTNGTRKWVSYNLLPCSLP